MKVLYVSKEMRNPQRLCNVYPRLSRMPCRVFWAKDNRAVEKHIRRVDVVFLNMIKETKWLASNSPVYDAPVPVARYFGDVWKIPGFRKRFEESRGVSCANFFRKYDFRIVPCKKLFERSCPGWLDNMLWSPHCIDAQHYDVPRDIDVLLWGRAGTVDYRTRAQVRQLVKAFICTKGKRFDECLVTYGMKLHGRKYKLAILAPKPRLYSGHKLYELLARAKVCCTAAPDCPLPGGGTTGAVGKFFENAACGAVTLSPDFADRKELGFEHGKNIWLADPAHYLGELAYLLEHLSLVKEMSKGAEELIRTRHTPTIRGRELYEFLCEKVGKA